MISAKSFPLKDLKRRKRQTILSVLPLSLVVAGAIFVIVVSENLNLRTRSIMEDALNAGFMRVFFDFTNLMVILSVLTGAVITYFLTSVNMSERRKDIGIMKSVGCLSHVVFGYFAAELCIIVVSSWAIGISFGVFLSSIYMNLNSGAFLGSQIVINSWSLLIFTLVFALVSIFLGIRPIVKAIQMESSRALAPQLHGATCKPNASASTLSFSFKIAYRTLLRKGYDTALIIICFALVMTLTTIMVAGATIVNGTTQNYIARAIGENVVLVGHPNISAKYVDLLSAFSPTEGPKVDFLDPDYRVSGILVSQLGGIPGVIRVDPRLVLEAQVHEVPGIIFVGEDSKKPVLLGDHRSHKAVIQGVELGHVVNEWLAWENPKDLGDHDSVILGDTLSSEITSYPSEQKVEINSKRFEIARVVLDPFNAGLVVYAPASSVSPLTNHTEYNLVLLKLGSSNYSDALREVKTELSGSGLTCVELDKLVENYVVFLESMWSPYVLLASLFLGAAIFCLFAHASLYMAEQEADFSIMKALGTGPKKIVTIILSENLIVTFLGGIPGVLIGFSITFFFLMPSPVISSDSLQSLILWLVLGLGLFLVSGFYSAFQALQKSVAHPMPYSL